MCYDPVHNVTECCTASCEVLGTGNPQWSVVQAAGPANPGGVQATFQGVTSLPASAGLYQCPWSPVLGAPEPRTVTLQLICDVFAAPNTMRVLRAFENTTCHWVIQAATSNACGCAPFCNGRMCGADGCGGYCSGDPIGLGALCPDSQVCMPDYSCCRPDCNGRTCGDDGCGTSCGACGADEVCSLAGVCLDQPGAAALPVYYAADGKGVAGLFFLGTGVGLVCALLLWVACLGGLQRINAWRFRNDGAAVGLVSAEGAALAKSTTAAVRGYGAT
jgi:hypothetical protein